MQLQKGDFPTKRMAIYAYSFEQQLGIPELDN